MLARLSCRACNAPSQEDGPQARACVEDRSVDSASCIASDYSSDRFASAAGTIFSSIKLIACQDLILKPTEANIRKHHGSLKVYNRQGGFPEGRGRANGLRRRNPGGQYNCKRNILPLIVFSIHLIQQASSTSRLVSVMRSTWRQRDEYRRFKTSNEESVFLAEAPARLQIFVVLACVVAAFGG